MDISVVIKTPVNQVVSDNAFDLGIFVSLNNGFDTLQVSSTFSVKVLAGAFCEVTWDDTNSLLGIERDSSETQVLTVTNIGNEPLDANFIAEIEAEDWTLGLSEESITGLEIGNSMDVELEVSASEDAKAGIEDLSFSCISAVDDVDYISTADLEVSVENSKSQGGLFGIVSAPIAYSIIGVIVLSMLIVARRIKKSAPTDLSGEELVSPDAHSIPDDGLRMQAVMDSVVGQDSLAGGSVSAEEIADALAVSIPSLPIPAPPVIPSGRPPSALPSGRPPAAVPAGRPPAISAPSGNVTINQTVIQNISDSVVQGDVSSAAPKAQVPAGPPLPPSGLPPGWSMAQWQHYGHQWLAQQGQQ